ncbi:alanine racemase [Fulvivirga maritima]|nr:alanine racemase [Fulvivirga maritima]UII24437.1 alanine racemase [Fulvivirga maritima]
MKEKADAHQQDFRPHFKTHQSNAIGEWVREAGVEAITVSSLGMAYYFAQAGWEDITVAFPFNILETEDLKKFPAHCRLTLLVDNEQTISYLSTSGLSLSIFIEIDSGAHRTGLSSSDYEGVLELIRLVKSFDNLTLRGLYSHAGHSYQCRGEAEVKAVHHQLHNDLKGLKAALKGEEDIYICTGDTPTCSVGGHFEGSNSLSPGNFVFYDVMQAEIGACSYHDIAVAVACPVVSKNADRKEICIYGGAIHFSKDSIEVNGNKSFGQLVESQGNLEWGTVVPDCYLKSLSQEHGLLKVTLAVFDQIQVGDVLMILPIHSCLAAESLGCYITTNGTELEHFSRVKSQR